MASKKIAKHAHPAWGLLCIALGVYPVGVALGLIPHDASSVHAPPWVSFVAGLVFVIAGFMLIIGPNSRWNNLLAAIICTIFASIGIWVAAYSLPGSIEGGIPFLPAETNNKIGRWMFGAGAMVCGLISLQALRMFFRIQSK